MDNDNAVGTRTDYLGALRRQWYVVLASVIVGALLAGGLLSVLPKAYGSTSSVLVEPTTSNTSQSDSRTVGAINMDTEAQVVKSIPVATAVKSATSSPLTAAQLAKRVNVNVPANTTILQITYQDSSATEAQAIAQAFATSYLDFRNTQATDLATAQTQRLDKQAQSAQRAIAATNRKIASLDPTSPERAGAVQDLAQLRSRLKWIQKRLLPLQTPPSSAGSIIADATVNKAPVKPNKVLVGGSSLGLCILLGLVLAWWRDGREGRLRSAREVEQDLQIEVLGTVNDTELGAVETNRRAVQQYRQVVHAAVARLGGSGALLVTGVGTQSMAEEVAATLSAELARTGTDVRLIYSDDRAARAFASSLANATRPPTVGLDATSLAALQVTVDGDVQNRDLPALLADAPEDTRQILFATPPTGLSADAQAISPYASFTLLVVTLDQNTHAEVAEALRQLHQVGASEVGAVVIAASSRKERKRSSARMADRERWLAARSSSVKGAAPVVGRPAAPVPAGDVEAPEPTESVETAEALEPDPEPVPGPVATSAPDEPDTLWDELDEQVGPAPEAADEASREAAGDPAADEPVDEPVEEPVDAADVVADDAEDDAADDAADDADADDEDHFAEDTGAERVDDSVDAHETRYAGAVDGSTPVVARADRDRKRRHGQNGKLPSVPLKHPR